MHKNTKFEYPYLFVVKVEELVGNLVVTGGRSDVVLNAENDVNSDDKFLFSTLDVAQSSFGGVAPVLRWESPLLE
jgi:hypothetical protein